VRKNPDYWRKDLRTGKARTDDAVAALKPIAKDAVPLLLEELKKNIAEIKYAVQLELILSKLPPGDLKIPLGKALEDRTLRQSAARIVGAAGDKELSKVLENYTSVSDDDFRLEAGAALVQCKNAAGIPPLVQSLKSAEWTNRTIAIDLLRKVNKGQDYGYKPRGTSEENAEAIKQWEEWAEKFGKTIFE
jgi:HEAT repeat protein